jgi:protein gp37
VGDKTKIEWTDATWNPVRGCSVVSEGCRNCYAMQVAARFSQPYWEVWQGQTLICSAKQKLTEAAARNKVANEAANGVVMEARPSSEGQAYEGLAYRNSSGAHWTGKVRLIEEHLEDPLRWKRPRKIFVNSMSDLFHESIPDEWIDRIFAVMALADWHTFQILTKRPERMRDYLNNSNCAYRVWDTAFNTAAAYPQLYELAERHLAKRQGDNPRWPLPGVWLGVSVEDQKTADERIPLLLQTPAAVRWISAEPLLGPIDLTHVDYSARLRETLGDFAKFMAEKDGDDVQASVEHARSSINAPAYLQTLTGQWFDGWDRGNDGKRLDWVVVGGESGANARPMHPDWVRSIRDQCVAAGVPFFFKQWGHLLPVGEVKGGDDVVPGTIVFAQDGERILPDCCSNDYDVEDGDAAIRFKPVGKKAAGHLLDGREWHQFPTVQTERN